MEDDDLISIPTDNGPSASEVEDIYAWIDSLKFSRPKKNKTHDFTDGVLMAELIQNYMPKIIDIRSYSPALSKKNKENNWDHLNTKVLSKLGIRIDKRKINEITENRPGAIEQVLYDLRPFLARQNRTILNYEVRKKISKNADSLPTNTSSNKPQPSSIPGASKRPTFPKPNSKSVGVAKPSEKKGTVVQKQGQESSAERRDSKTRVIKASTRHDSAVSIIETDRFMETKNSSMDDTSTSTFGKNMTRMRMPGCIGCTIPNSMSNAPSSWLTDGVKEDVANLLNRGKF